MRYFFFCVVLIAVLLSCETKAPTVIGEMVDLPRPFSVEDCLDTQKLSKLGISYGKGGRQGDEVHYPFTWKDTSLSDNGTVVGGTYFGNFILRLKNELACENWMAIVDSIQLGLGERQQTIPVEKFAIYLHEYRKPKIEFFGNDTTYLQGFRVFLSGFSGATGNTIYDYYILDVAAGKFERDTVLSSLPRSQIDLERGIVRTGWNGGAVGRLGGMTYYRYTKNRKLEFLRSWHSDYFEDSREIFLVKYSQMKNGKRFTWEERLAFGDWPPGNWR